MTPPKDGLGEGSVPPGYRSDFEPVIAPWDRSPDALAGADGSEARFGEPRLLAVDAGLRAGLARYGGDGRLLAYRSTNFGSVKRLRRGVYGVLRDLPALEWLLVEGGGEVADPWIREGERRGLRVRQLHAGAWRPSLLLPRERRRGSDAKAQADVLARRVIEWSGVARPTSLRHDAAEAILIGLWGVLQVGWLPAVPREILQG